MKKKPTPFIVGFFYPRQTPSSWQEMADLDGQVQIIGQFL